MFCDCRAAWSRNSVSLSHDEHEDAPCAHTAMQDARGSLLCVVVISMRVTEVMSLQGGTVAYVQLCRALDYQDVGSNAMVPTPGGVNIGPIDSRMQQTPYMQGTLWGGDSLFHLLDTLLLLLHGIDFWSFELRMNRGSLAYAVKKGMQDSFGPGSRPYNHIKLEHKRQNSTPFVGREISRIMHGHSKPTTAVVCLYP